MSFNLDSTCIVNVCWKVNKVVLPSFSVNTVSVQRVNVANVITTSTWKYINPVSNYAAVRESDVSTPHINISLVLEAVTFNSTCPWCACVCKLILYYL